LLEINKIYNADCIGENGMQLIDDKSVNLILCDLPYNTTKSYWDSLIPPDKLWEQYERIIKDNGAILLFCSQPFTSVLGASNLKLLRYEIIWNKRKAGNFAQGNKQPLKIHENVLVFYKKQPTYNPQKIQLDKPQTRHKGKLSENRKDREDAGGLGGQIKYSDKYEPDKKLPTSIKEFKKDNYKGNIFHPTQKPVDFCEDLILTYSNEGDLVLDNCVGSGSTVIACINTNRNFIGFDNGKNDTTGEYWVDIANRRIEEHKYRMII